MTDKDFNSGADSDEVTVETTSVFRADFLSVRLQDGHLYGSLIDILRNGAPTILIALGMTLVIATRGIDV